jgi:hypothetical protein
MAKMGTMVPPDPLDLLACLVTLENLAKMAMMVLLDLKGLLARQGGLVNREIKESMEKKERLE